MKRANTILIYGESGTFKTTQVGFLARWIWKKFQKRTRLISTDDGNWSCIQPYIDAGIIDAYNVSALDSPTTVLRKLCRGDWPKPTGNNQCKLIPTTPEEWEKIGLIAYEGLTATGDLALEELRRDQRKISEDAVSAFEIRIGLSDKPEKYSANNRAHFHFVQNEVHGHMRSLASLPVDYVLYTAHESKTAEDESTREPIRGPAIAGKAVTSRVSGWVGDCIHFDDAAGYQGQGQGKAGTGKAAVVKVEIPQTVAGVRAYFVRHRDPKFPQISYPAKLRIPVDLASQVWERWPGGYFEPDMDGGLDRLIELEYELNRKATEALRAQGINPAEEEKTAA